MKRIESLTGLRGIAALIVFISHAANMGYFHPALGNGLGKIGVMLFFVLSGFLMAHLYLERDFSTGNVMKYAQARVARVFPLYLFTLFTCYLIGKFVYDSFAYKKILAETVLLQSAAFYKAPHVFWSIPVEVQFYVVFLGFWWLRSNGIGKIGQVGYMLLVASPSILTYAATGEKLSIVSSYSYSFFAGIFVAIFYDRLKSSMLLVKGLNWIAVVSIVLFFLNLPWFRLKTGTDIGGSMYVRMWLDPINWIVVMAIFISVAMDSKLYRWLQWRPFMYLGEVSFAFYLLHYPVLDLLRDFGYVNPLYGAVALSVSVALASLSLVALERPASKATKALFNPVAGFVVRKLGIA